MSYIILEDHRHKKQRDRATEDESTTFQSLEGELVLRGCQVLRRAYKIGCRIQQRVSHLPISDITGANSALREIKSNPAFVKFRRTRYVVTDATGVSFSDVGIKNCACSSYEQSDSVIGLYLKTENTGSKIYHLLDLANGKHRCVTNSSYFAEITSGVDADHRGLHMKLPLQSVFPARLLRHALIMKQKGLYDRITALHKGQEYRGRQTVQRMRD